MRALACLVVLGCLASPSAALAGDSWTAPSDLFFQSTETDNTSSYGEESFEPTAARSGCPALGKTAWWRIAGNGQSMTLSTALAPTSFDTVVSVYTGTPPAPTFVACNDDLEGDLLNRSQVTFATQRGTSYLVQVGGWDSCAGQLPDPCPKFGALAIRATSPLRPANDDRADAAQLVTGAPAQSDNTGASYERGEDAACDGVPFAGTVWYRWSAPAVGAASFYASAAFPDTVVAVYRADTGARVGCNDNAPGSAGSSRLDLRVSSGDYLVQIGARGADGSNTGQGSVVARTDFVADRDIDNDGELASTDCNDADPTIRHDIVDVPDDGIDQDCSGADAINLDRDGDGFNRGTGGLGDCNDADPKIHPQVRDIPGNKIDEDCTDGPAPYPRLASSVAFALKTPFRFLRLRIRRAVAGSRIELRCKGGGCFKRKVIHVRRSRAALSVSRFVVKARPRRGAVVEVRLTKPGSIGFMKRFTSRGGRKDPKVEELCLAEGTSKRQKC